MSEQLDNVIRRQTGIRVKLVGENGNIYNLMGIVSRALKKHNRQDLSDEMIKRITKDAKSYSEALAMLGEYVVIK